MNADYEQARASEWSTSWLQLWLTSLAALFREQPAQLYDQPSGHTYAQVMLWWVFLLCFWLILSLTPSLSFSFILHIYSFRGVKHKRNFIENNLK